MPQRGKQYVTATRAFDREKLYAPPEAVDLLKSQKVANFDETIELAVRLGVDPRKPDQIVRTSVSLPAGSGRTVRVAVFASGDAANEAREAGADVIGADDLVARVQNEGFLDFDKAVATPDMMGQVGRLGRILGPRNMMPNPKDGTVTAEVGKVIRDLKGGQITCRTDKTGNIHAAIGKKSFDRKALLDNIRAVIDELNRAKPPGAKGRYMRSITLTSTMGPGIKIDPARVKPTDEEVEGAA